MELRTYFDHPVPITYSLRYQRVPSDNEDDQGWTVQHLQVHVLFISAVGILFYKANWNFPYEFIKDNYTYNVVNVPLC